MSSMAISAKEHNVSQVKFASVFIDHAILGIRYAPGRNIASQFLTAAGLTT
jgi:hypothetical protein